MTNLIGTTIRKLLVIVCLTMIPALVAEEKEPATKKAPEGFYDLESPQASSVLKRFSALIILDIRTPKEFAAGHLKGAKNLDFFNDDFGAKLDKLDKSKGYVVHCASGGRSGRSMKMFKEKGFNTVYHIADGYKGWIAAKLPVVVK